MTSNSITLLEDSNTTIKESTIQNHQSSSQTSQKCNLFNLQRLRLLGSGKTADVYLCRDPASSENNPSLCALKVFKPHVFQEIHDQEVRILKQLEHPDIISMINYDEISIKFEYASQGDMFQYVLSRPFESNLARYYMVQLLNVLDYMQQVGICHRDLKLENLFLDEDFQLKVGDFGLAAFTQAPSSSKQPTINEELSVNGSTDCSESNESSYLSDFVGTESYMAPEIISHRKYFGEQVDIFALGVILFSFTHGFPPYQRIASKTDPFYKLILEKKFDLYWSILEKKTKIIKEPLFKDFINKLLEPIPSKRITLEEIKRHPWMQGEIYTPKELSKAMLARKQLNQVDNEQPASANADSDISTAI